MATKTKRPKGKEILEDPEAIIEKIKDSEEFFQKNKKTIYIIAGVVLAVGAAVFLYQYQTGQNNENAQSEMFNAVFAWEKDSLKLALDGDGKTVTGLTDIAEQYSGTDAGNLAKFYSGVAYLKQEKFDEAIEMLEDFSSNDLLLQGYIYSLTGDAYMEKNDFENAAKYYEKACRYKPNKGFTPNYLMKLALAYELQQEYSSAAEAYEKIIKEYPGSRNFNDAKKYKARAEGLAASKE
jgi:tetratricopeptide (TPR) repeat protein